MPRQTVLRLASLLVAGALAACQADPPTSPANVEVQAADSARPPTGGTLVLVDASHDGGVWWYPQVAPFDPTAPHQGRALADYLRRKGYQVDELARGNPISPDLLARYAIVIRAGSFGAYRASETAAYQQFVSAPHTLLLLGEFLRQGQTDPVAEALGIPFTGWVTGTVTDFAAHEITAGVTSIAYIAGATLPSDIPRDLRILGRLDTGAPVMGVLDRGVAKVFFIGDTNGLELVPQPLVDNLLSWGSAAH